MRARIGVDRRRLLPSVDQALQRPEVQALVDAHGRPPVLRALRSALDGLRRRATSAPDGLDEAVAGLARDVASRLEAAGQPSLRRVLNATGVVVHTNLGRAPLSPEAAARVAEIASSYSNLEYDLERGARGNRETHAESRLRELLSVEATVVVNNCAAAVLLAVNTLAEGRDVLVSRGELVEIGGSFRIPDVVRKGGARLREIGTTNRTRIADFRAARKSESRVRLVVPTSRSRAPPLRSTSGMRKEPPISTSSPRLTSTSVPSASVLTARSTAAAQLLTTTVASTPSSSRRRASAWASRSPRSPRSRSYSRFE